MYDGSQCIALRTFPNLLLVVLLVVGMDLLKEGDVFIRVVFGHLSVRGLAWALYAFQRKVGGLG